MGQPYSQDLRERVVEAADVRLFFLIALLAQFPTRSRRRSQS